MSAVELPAVVPRIEDYMVTHRGVCTEEQYQAMNGRPLRIQLNRDHHGVYGEMYVIDMHTREYWTIETQWAERIADEEEEARASGVYDEFEASIAAMSEEEQLARLRELMAAPRPE